MRQLMLLITSVALLGLTVDTRAATRQEPEWKVPSRQARKKNPLADDSSASVQGKVVFDAQCVSCHGSSGIGDGVAAKDLEKHPGDLTSSKVQDQSDGALFWKITTGRAPMTAFGDTLSVEERWQVVRFIREFGASSVTVVTPELAAPEPLRRPLTSLQRPYDQLRRSLARGDQDAASAALPALNSALEDLKKVDVRQVGDVLAEPWRQSLGAIEKATASMRDAPNLQEMRSSFSGLSAAAEAAWARFGHTMKSPLFVFECSRATPAGAARWVQASREPANPYLGSKEASCVRLLRRIAATRN